MGLVTICISAFVSVFFLLALLALVMNGILHAFPAPPPEPAQLSAPESDATMIAGIAAAAQHEYPGTRVTKIEEAK